MVPGYAAGLATDAIAQWFPFQPAGVPAGQEVRVSLECQADAIRPVGLTSVCTPLPPRTA